MPRPRPASRR